MKSLGTDGKTCKFSGQKKYRLKTLNSLGYGHNFMGQQMILNSYVVFLVNLNPKKKHGFQSFKISCFLPFFPSNSHMLVSNSGHCHTMWTASCVQTSRKYGSVWSWMMSAWPDFFYKKRPAAGIGMVLTCWDGYEIWKNIKKTWKKKHGKKHGKHIKKKHGKERCKEKRKFRTLE